MILTNEHGIPEEFVRAIQNDAYDMGEADFSVTGLVQPPQITRLREKHDDDISIDVSDRIYMLLGTGVHNVLERVNRLLAEEQGMNSSNIAEERFFATHHSGTKISGAIDLLKGDGSMIDYKISTVYTARKPLKLDWEAQLNMYAWLLRQNDLEATKLTIDLVCKDWSKGKAKREAGYPNSPIVSMSVPLWSEERQDRYVDSRVAIHTAEATAPYTNEERWARGGYKAVPGKGKSKKFDSLSEAATWINRHKTGGFTVLDEQPQFIRCESWCEVSDFCPQWKGEKGNAS